MKTKHLIVVTWIFLGLGNLGYSQNSGLAINSSDYNTAIGLRAGETSGLTVKHFFSQNNAVEGIFGAWHHGFSITGLYERHASAFGTAGLNWYYGAGGHVSFASDRTYYYHRHGNRRYEYYSDGRVGVGIDGIFGMEYKIPKAPIAFSLDLKPYIEFVSNGGVWTSLDPGLGIKVTF